MNEMKRVPLYERLPEIYRIRDAEQLPPGQLEAYLKSVEQVFGALHENIEALWNDLFIETCDDWVIPYLADLIGTSHLKGDPRTLRADVADTIALRRRKGTLGAIERLAANLTGWPCRAVELFPNLAWAQHLNHQRPDRGGKPPYGELSITRFTPRRGGTVALRDPAMLSLVGTAFDPFAYTPDVKRADDGARHINLPNLAIYLWRLNAYRLAVTRPLLKGVQNLGVPPAASNRARFIVRFDLDPLDRPVRLFNSYQRPEADTQTGTAPLTAPDAVAAPILPARLESTSEAGNPKAYFAVDSFVETANGPEGLDISDVGLQLYIPESILDGVNWRVRSANLCAWETGMSDEVDAHDIVIDPEIGRVLIGVATLAERNALISGPIANPRPRVFFGYTYGAVAPIGAHPVSRDPAPVDGAEIRVVNGLDPTGPSLQDTLQNLQNETGPVVVEIRDSLVHELNPATLAGTLVESGNSAIRLAHGLIIRAVGGAKPVIRLAAPLAFRPVDTASPLATTVSVDLNGLFITAAAGFVGPLIARAALARLELSGCTLDPGGQEQRDQTRVPMQESMRLTNGYGFAVQAEEDEFSPTPDIILNRTIAGSIAMDDGYQLRLQDSIVDAGVGPGDAPGARLAIGPASPPVVSHAAPLSVRGATILGRVLVREARGSGGIFSHRLSVWNHQTGCLKHCYFSGDSDRLPPNFACVSGDGVRLVFSSIRHGTPGYGQLARGTDFAILNRGPGDDAMGATGFLLEAHKWINLNVRLREFMPVGVRPLVLPMT